jgi:Glycosyltransferase family 9 (heptosyltransferase)
VAAATVAVTAAEAPGRGHSRKVSLRVVSGPEDSRLGVPAVVLHPERLALPEATLDGPRSFVFAANGGMGDICVALQTALEFVRLVAPMHPDHEWVFALASGWYASMGRLLRGMRVFDRVADLGRVVRLKSTLRHTPTLLPAVLAGNDDEACLALGRTSDFLWAQWGMRGRCPTSEISPAVTRMKEALLAPQFARLRARQGYPGRNEFVVLCPESSYLGNLKAWPVERWGELVRDVRNTGREVVVCASPAAYDELAAAARSPCLHFDYTQPELSSDLANLSCVLDAAAAVVALDSGPAHLASLLGVRGISLWGPTSPAIFASPNSVILRASLCPPCSADSRSRRCADNVCMKAIQSDVVARLLRRVIADAS